MKYSEMIPEDLIIYKGPFTEFCWITIKMNHAGWFCLEKGYSENKHEPEVNFKNFWDLIDYLGKNR